MRINFLYKGVLVAAMLCVAPAALPASPKASQPDAHTPASRKESFAASASNLLQEVQADALSVRYKADHLEARLRDPFENDWEYDAVLLDGAREQVNAMDKLLSQLRANKSEALPWQQKAIDRIAPSVVNLADTTQDAVVALNNNQGRVFFSNLGVLADHMYNEAKLIDQAIGNLEKYANARGGAQQLRQTSRLKNNS
jgi:hypothetical protein